MDWNGIRAFVVVAEEGSLSKAAEILRISQPTLGRQLNKLEESLDLPLMTRSPRGMTLTDRGEELLANAKLISEQVRLFERLATGSRTELRGRVRIAASEIIGVKVLTPMISKVREAYPNIEVELVLDNRPSNLLRGEADIAIRMFNPKHVDLFAKRVGLLPTGLFASPGYVARRGLPTNETLFEHDLIGFDPRGPYASLMQGFDSRMTADIFKFRTDSLVAQLEYCVTGGGIAALQTEIAKRDELVSILPELKIPDLPMWIVMHRDVRRGAHFRQVYNVLSRSLKEYADNIVR